MRTKTIRHLLYANAAAALLFLDVPVMLRDRRRLATGLAFGNCCTACVLLIQQTQIWRSPWGWPLVLTPAVLTLGFTWAALQAPDVEGGLLLESLSEREIEVLRQLAHDRTNREIGESLN